MHYYKHIENNSIISFETSENENNSKGYIEISLDEYQDEINKLSTYEEDKIDKDEYIRYLEEENAALLYQVLTGEEL